MDPTAYLMNSSFLCLIYVFASGYFPSAWSDAILVPVFKSGEVNDPSNYRGISLISSLGKLFTTTRLLKWASNNDILTDAQFTFRNGYCTTDAIFSVYSFIQNTMCNGKRLYCCYVDYQRAFDSVNLRGLWL